MVYHGNIRLNDGRSWDFLFLIWEKWRYDVLCNFNCNQNDAFGIGLCVKDVLFPLVG